MPKRSGDPIDRPGPVVSFVIPVRNDAEGLRRCLASIERAAASRACEIVVVDNGSEDGSADVARAAGARVLVRPGEPVAALRNAGAAASSGDVFAFVDADHAIAPDWLEHVLAAFADGTITAVGAPYRAPPGSTWIHAAYDLLRDHREGRRDVAWLGSGNLAVRRAAFERSGGFDEGLRTCEDVDLCARLRRGGGRIVADGAIESVHFGDPETLRARFVAELWRGRDGLRVAFRQPFELRDAAALVPAAVVLGSAAALAAGAAAALSGSEAGAVLALAGAAGFGLVVLQRVARLRRRGGEVGGLRLAAFALVYESARALALVVRSRHRRERERGGR